MSEGLDVQQIRPAPTAGNRWRRLARGTTLVSAPVDNALNLDEVATHLANELHTLNRRQAA